jgi:folate-binding protein YgfZ
MLHRYYKAATEAAAITELDYIGLIKLTGNDRISWLQGMVTNDVAKLAPGAGCYAAHLTPQGKIVAQMHVYKEEEALWLSLERASTQRLLEDFDKLLIMEDVQLADVSADYCVLGLLGPNAGTALAAWYGGPLEVDGLYSHRRVENSRVVVSRLGYEIWVPRTETDAVLRFFAGHGVTAIDHGTWDVLRCEAGIPIYGIDIDETTTMPELGEDGISYDKGCYIGQEVVAKVKYIGHVNRRFVGLVMPGDKLPELKSPVRKGGREVGYVTTALFSPGLNSPIALGFVSRSVYAAGTEVEVSTGVARIVELPFKPLIARPASGPERRDL